MNSRDRFLAALAREEPDRVPLWELIINKPVIEALHGDITYADMVEAEDLDGITIFENQQMTPGPDNRQIDEWGISWGASEVGIPYPVSGPIATEEDLDTYEPPDPQAPHRLRDLEAALSRFGGRRAIVFLTHDAHEFSINLHGMAELYQDYLLDPKFARRLADTVIEYKKGVLERALEMGADAIVAGDDYAGRTGPFLSPKHFDQFVSPYLQQIIRVTHRRDTPFIKHTDGDIWPLLDRLADLRIDAIDPLEPLAGMDIGEVKAAYGDRMAVVGNVDCSELLSRGAPADVVEAVKETIAKGSPGGGHILASSNSIHPAVRPENYRTMVEAGRLYGRYPLDEEMVREYRERSYIAPYLAGAAPNGEK